MGKANTIQEHFVLVNDNGSETGSTLGTTDGNWTQDVDTVFRVRFCITETGGGTEAATYELRYSTGGAYNLVTGSTPIQNAASAEDGWTITDGDATTNRLAGTGSFIAGEYSEDATTNTITITSEFTNIEFCVSIDSAQVAHEDTLTLRVYFSGGTALDSYSVTPTITVNEALGVSPSDSISVSESVGMDVTRTIGQSQGTLLSDTFTDTDSTSITAHTPDTNPAGNSYVDNVGTTIINSNTAFCDDSANQVQIDIEYDGGYVVEADYTPQAVTSSHGGLLLRIGSGTSNYVFVGSDTDTSFVLAYRSGAGLNIVDSDSSFVFVAGTTYRLRVVIDDNDNFYATVDGGNLISGNITTHAGNTLIGFKGRSNARFDNFGVQDLGIVDHIGVAESVSVSFGADEHDVSASDSISISESVGITLVHTVNVSDSISITEDIREFPVYPYNTILEDDFQDNSQNTAKWSKEIYDDRTDQAVTVLEQSNRLEINARVGTGGAYNGYLSVNGYVFSDRELIVELVQADVSDTTIVNELLLIEDKDNIVGFDIEGNGQIYFFERIDGTSDFTNIAYNATNHRWLRIRHVSSDDTWRWDTSADGQTWNQQRSKSRAIDNNNMLVNVLGGSYDTITTAGTSIWDNLILGPFPSVSDSISISESVKTVLIPLPNVSDSITVTESVTADVSDPQIIESESVGAAESVNMTLVHNVSTSDSITVQDLPRYYDDEIVVTEKVTVSVQAAGTDHNISVSDSISVAEAVELVLNSFVNVSDSIGVSETIKLILEALVSVSDSVSVSDAVDLTLIDLVSVTDSISVSEFVSLLLENLVIVNDSVSVSESVTAILESFISVNDTISVAEGVTVILSSGTDINVIVSDSISVSESVIVRIGDLQISLSDSISVSESVSTLLQSFITVQDITSISESVNLNLIPLIGVSDSVSVSESVSTLLEMLVSISDSITVSEAISVSLIAGDAIVINVSDSMGVTESILVELPDALVATASDSISVSENIGTIIESNISVSDAISVTEAILSVIPDALAVSSSDSVVVSESISMLSELLVVSSDGISIADSASVTSIINLSTSDSITVNESVKALLLILLLASENVSVSEVLEFTGDMQASVSDSISLSESVEALVYEGISYEDIFKRMFIAHFRGMR